MRMLTLALVNALCVDLSAACDDATSASAAPIDQIGRPQEIDAGNHGAVVVQVDGETPPMTSGDVLTLFDATLTADWRMSTIRNQPGRDDPGHFTVEGGLLVAHPGTDLGLLWNAQPTPPNFVLELEWRLSSEDDNSGIFLRFPDPETKAYDNSAWVAIDFGFEVQINEPGSPDGAPEHTTGAIYGQSSQAFRRVVANAPGAWNTYSIRVQGDEYTVHLNGQEVTRYIRTVAGRGAPTTVGAPAFVGIQTHTGNTAFRNIRLRALVP